MSTKSQVPQRTAALSLLFLTFLVAPWTSHISAVRADADDIVFLKSGGRARGLVIESDPATGTRIKLHDGTVRVFEAAAVDHVTYGDTRAAATPPSAAKPAPNPPLRQPSGTQPSAASDARQPRPVAESLSYNPMQGALRIESSEPGRVFIEGGEYGSTPLVVPNLTAGQHRVTIRFHAGDSDARIVNVRGGTETLVSFETTSSLRAFNSHQGWHFGLGVEGGFTMFDENDGAPEIHLVLRANHAVSRQLEMHADARLGAFGAQIFTDYSSYTTTGTPGLLLGGDAQLNLGSVYTMSIGVDVGALIGVGPVAGAHLSPIGLRLGSERAVLLALQAGVMTGNDGAGYSFVLGATYLFL